MIPVCAYHGVRCTCDDDRGQFYDTADFAADPSGQAADEAAGREQDAREASW